MGSEGRSFGHHPSSGSSECSVSIVREGSRNNSGSGALLRYSCRSSPEVRVMEMAVGWATPDSIKYIVRPG